MKLIGTLFTVCLIATCSFGQTWKNYSLAGHVLCVVTDADTIWIGTQYNGVAKYLNNGTLLEIYTRADGLADNQVNAITVDKVGNKWFGTYAGASKFNGTTWTTYNSANSGIVDNDITSIAIDTSGNPWFVCYSVPPHPWGGVSTYNGITWIYYTIPYQLTSINPTTISIDKYNHVWVGFDGGGACEFIGNTWMQYYNLDTNTINAYGVVYGIAQDSAGNVWIASYPGVVKYEQDNNWIYYGMDTSGIYSLTAAEAIAVDSRNNIWVSSEFLWKFDGISWTSYNPQNSPVPHVDVTAMSIDRHDNKWLVGIDSFYKFSDTICQAFCPPSSGLSGFPGPIISDAQNNMWFGASNGAVKFDGANWATYTTANSGLLSNSIKSMAFDKQNNIIWFGTDANISTFDGNNWVTYNNANAGIYDTNVVSIAIDRNNNKWFATKNGLVKYDGATWTIYDTANSGLPVNTFTSVVVDSQNHVWVGTIANGIIEYDGSTWVNYSATNSALTSNRINAGAVDKQGIVWLGTDNGVSKFDGANWTTYITADSGLPSLNIAGIMIDHEGNKWFATDMGVSVFDGNKFTAFTISNSGLACNDVSYAAIDNQDSKWFSTCEGVSELIGFTTAISNISEPNKYFEVYPNPTNGKLEIAIQNPSSNSMQITWMNISGQTISHQTINADIKNELDVSPLPAGMYFIQLQDGQQNLVRKFVKE